MTAKTDNYQVGFDALAARNFVLDTDVAGALRFKRGQANQTPVSTPMWIDKDDNLRLLSRGGANPGFGVQADSIGKNILMNADGVINQRVAGVISGPQSANYCDRWRIDSSILSTYTMQSLGWIDLGGNYGAHRAVVATQKPSLAVGDYAQFLQSIEGIYIRDLAWGSGNGGDFQQSVTFSCWAYISSNAPYTFCVNFRSGASASYVHPFTIPVAGVWTRFTHTVPAPVIGTFATDNTSGLQFAVCLAAAPNGTYTTPNADVWQAQNFIAHTSITNFVGLPVNTAFAMSAPQIEPGKVASRFQKPEFTTELERCKRYWETSYPYGVPPGSITIDGQIREPAFNADTLLITYPLPRVPKRTSGGGFNVWNPTTGVIHNVRITSNGGTVPLTNYGGISFSGPNLMSSSAGFTANQFYEFQWAMDCDV